MKTVKRLAALLVAVLMLLALSGCGTTTTTGDKDNSGNNNGGSSQSGESAIKDGIAENGVTTAYPEKEVGFQLELPEKGEQVAILHTSMGDISLRFFPEAAPKTVENFLTHAKNGYYDGLIFHRVIEDFMIQGGDPKGNGTGGESIWGKAFEDEFDQKLLNLRGSISMANSGVNTNGSQFFINQAPASKFDKSNYDDFEGTYSYFQQYYDYYSAQEGFTDYYPTLDSFIEANGGINPLPAMVPDAVWDLYEEIGGNINLDGAFRAKGGHTVFGQVYAGMDVVDAIAKVETNDSDKPATDVVINSIEVTTY